MTNRSVLSIDGTCRKGKPAERILQDGAGRNRDVREDWKQWGQFETLLTPENRRGNEQA